jgi:hypothetical protein
VAYIVNKGQKGPNNLMLDSFIIENKELKEYKQHILERYDAEKETTIKDMMIIEQDDKLSVLLVLTNQVLLVKMRG